MLPLSADVAGVTLPLRLQVLVAALLTEALLRVLLGALLCRVVVALEALGGEGVSLTWREARMERREERRPSMLMMGFWDRGEQGRSHGGPQVSQLVAAKEDKARESPYGLAGDYTVDQLRASTREPSPPMPMGLI
ncbi:hypothetical protein K437DRAFT_256612 [Tilletiaria anomala UBC 951]|uniref:Uncharacterized protein n=1 Tax=Tilletiaria anomala (strain ATCC 24038 / CBS 436.72 / UBC 951) TaxID=1037660 RepID=A0A066VUX1_TILAU|nr:uncharacterized protein K437DRAFT_256612 [Tilletiaria anomala UBC 951]KDN45276.1 hypothetical protein K437DRAFT_256612 [Tilletiaria anomala UBC 951]